MSRIYRVLGQKGRVTLPYAIRLHRKFSDNDIVSFEEQEDGSVITAGKRFAAAAWRQPKRRKPPFPVCSES